MNLLVDSIYGVVFPYIFLYKMIEYWDNYVMAAGRMSYFVVNIGGMLILEIVR